MTAAAKARTHKPLPSNEEICEAFTRAAQEVAWRHKQLGHPLIRCTSDRQTIEVAPEDIPDEWLPPEKRRNGHGLAFPRSRKHS